MTARADGRDPIAARPLAHHVNLRAYLQPRPARALGQAFPALGRLGPAGSERLGVLRQGTVSGGGVAPSLVNGFSHLL
jgi:hypothetical protein